MDLRLLYALDPSSSKSAPATPAPFAVPTDRPIQNGKSASKPRHAKRREESDSQSEERVKKRKRRHSSVRSEATHAVSQRVDSETTYADTSQQDDLNEQSPQSQIGPTTHKHARLSTQEELPITLTQRTAAEREYSPTLDELFGLSSSRNVRGAGKKAKSKKEKKGKGKNEAPEERSQYGRADGPEECAPEVGDVSGSPHIQVVLIPASAPLSDHVSTLLTKEGKEERRKRRREKKERRLRRRTAADQLESEADAGDERENTQAETAGDMTQDFALLEGDDATQIEKGKDLETVEGCTKRRTTASEADRGLEPDASDARENPQPEVETPHYCSVPLHDDLLTQTKKENKNKGKKEKTRERNKRKEKTRSKKPAGRDEADRESEADARDEMENTQLEPGGPAQNTAALDDSEAIQVSRVGGERLVVRDEQPEKKARPQGGVERDTQPQGGVERDTQQRGLEMESQPEREVVRGEDTGEGADEATVEKSCVLPGTISVGRLDKTEEAAEKGTCEQVMDCEETQCAASPVGDRLPSSSSQKPEPQQTGMLHPCEEAATVADVADRLLVPSAAIDRHGSNVITQDCATVLSAPPTMHMSEQGARDAIDEARLSAGDMPHSERDSTIEPVAGTVEQYDAGAVEGNHMHMLSEAERKVVTFLATRRDEARRHVDSGENTAVVESEHGIVDQEQVRQATLPGQRRPVGWRRAKRKHDVPLMEVCCRPKLRGSLLGD